MLSIFRLSPDMWNYSYNIRDILYTMPFLAVLWANREQASDNGSYER
jgi:hypothetical protein